MKKLLLPSIIAMLASLPAFADTVTTLPNNALCNETNLGTESGSADIEVVWEPNTINTQWFTGYGENTAAASATTCSYGGTINLPQTNPSRPGYAFAGWKLRAQCLIPSTDVNNNAEYESTGCLDINGAGACAGKGGFDQNAPNYGISDPGQWGVTWSNGDKVTGVALCSQTSGTWATTGTPDETGSGETGYCWCKATHYTANNAQQCSLSSPSWVFLYGSGSAAGCAYLCAYDCANDVLSNSDFRLAVFGGAGT